ncbi:hypothetical protein ACFL59_07775, partial [Planctomycetota bacterium]
MRSPRFWTLAFVTGLAVSGSLTSGCGYIGIGTAVVVSAVGGGGGGATVVTNSPPVVSDVKLSEVRDPSQVAVDFRVTDAEGDPVDVLVRYCTGAGTAFQPATVSVESTGAPIQQAIQITNAAPGVLRGLPGSKTGELVRILWDAAHDLDKGGASTHFRLSINVLPVGSDTPSAGSATVYLPPLADPAGDATNVRDNVPENEPPLRVGNDAPHIAKVEVKLDAEDKTYGNVVVCVTVSDSTEDPTKLLSFAFSEIGDFSDAVPVFIDRANFPVGPLHSGTTAVATAGGEEQRYTWASKVATATKNLDARGARIRIQLQDFVGGEAGLSSNAKDSDPFELDNGNSTPTVTITGTIPATLPSPVSGLVAFEFVLTDADEDSLSLIPTYSTDDTSYSAAEGAILELNAPPHAPGLEPFGLASGSYRFEWDTISPSQIGFGNVASATFRLVATDGREESAPAYAPSRSMHIDNRHLAPAAPVVQISTVTPGAGKRYLKTATVTYTLTDSNAGQTVDVDVHFSANYDPQSGAGDWYAATRGAGGDDTIGLGAGASGTTHTFVWEALADAMPGNKGLSASAIDTDGDGDTDDDVVVAPAGSVYFQIKPADSVGTVGVAALSVPFPLGDLPPTLQILVPATRTVGLAGDVPLEFKLTDV